MIDTNEPLGTFSNLTTTNHSRPNSKVVSQGNQCRTFDRSRVKSQALNWQIQVNVHGAHTVKNERKNE